MTEESKIVLRGEKNARIISAMCELYSLDMITATDIYYTSETSALIEEKVSDLHCRSDKYLATLVMDEYEEGVALLSDK